MELRQRNLGHLLVVDRIRSTPTAAAGVEDRGASPLDDR
jgi:hypothetical protein